jgi:hypothetical protein
MYDKISYTFVHLLDFISYLVSPKVFQLIITLFLNLLKSCVHKSNYMLSKLRPQQISFSLYIPTYLVAINIHNHP